MHRHVREYLEEVLAKDGREPGRVIGEGKVSEHLKACSECSDELAAMRAQAALLRKLRPAQEAEPNPGFYARVMERIESQAPVSIWNLFFDSAFGRRIAVASLALAVLLGIYLVSGERGTPVTDVALTPDTTAIQMLPASSDGAGLGGSEDGSGVVLTQAPDQDSVLVNLVTYREQ